VPAGDIGVGGREIGFMFGQYKRIRNEFSGVFTGKGLEYGGSLIRPEATGYGTVYFAQEMLATINEGFKGKTVAISGSGNVAQFATKSQLNLGGIVVTLSDSNGYIYDKDGIDDRKTEFIMNLKNMKRGRIREYADDLDANMLKAYRGHGWRNAILPCPVLLRMKSTKKKPKPW
jgi:glutamate dehydrogenase (NADP+)